jgi:hypothetical protein
MMINLRIRITALSLAIFGELLLTAVFPSVAAAVQDVMLQTMNGQVVSGIVEDQTGVGTLGARVYRGQFLSNFLAANPGFYGLRTGDPNMPPGAAGFPSEHDVGFDLLPMWIGCLSSNLFYWDGSDANGGGIDSTDIKFVVPAGISWSVRDAPPEPIPSSLFLASGTDKLVAGGVIDHTSEDIWADGVDSGTIHEHLALQLSDNDGNSGTSPPQGVYMISWQARSVGFETSDPFLFVFRTSSVSNAARDVAANWAIDNIDAITSPPVLPGDFNGDGIVDAADYVAWRKGGPLLNEIHDEGTASPADYADWQASFGNMGGCAGGGTAGGQAVPEPAASLMFIAPFAGAAMMGTRRRRSGLPRNSRRNDYTQQRSFASFR